VGLLELFLHHYASVLFVGRIFAQQFQHFRAVQHKREKIAAFAEKSEEFIRKQEKTLLDVESQQKYNEFKRNLNMLDDDKIANIKEKIIKEPSRLSKLTIDSFRRLVFKNTSNIGKIFCG
jgi:hypothetical protein